jgi:hypothetical protein
MQINLQIHIHLDGVDLDHYLTRLALLFAPPSPQTAPDVFEGPDAHTPSPTAQETPVLPATEETATDAPTTPTPKKANPAKRTARLAGSLGGLPEPKQRNMTTARLPFDELDGLVRSEMKRLSMDKRMPGHTLWNAERDPRLPTLTAICYRYNVSNIVELAEKLEMLPPLSATLEPVQGKGAL